MRTIPLGEAIVSVFNVGDFTWRLSEKLNVPESEWRPHYSALFQRPQLFPTQSIHVALPEASLLIDPSHHDIAPDSSFVPPDYQQQPDLTTQLLKNGIHPEDITHVVITHAHFDHYASITMKQNGYDVPCFPHARCFLGQAEWQRPEIQHALLEPDSNESRTLGLLQKQGLLELVEEDLDLFPEVCIIAAPGETPGHQIVQVHSAGQMLYCLGDLYHHSVEVEHPTWMTHWKDRETTLRSCHELVEAALAEHAFIVAAHIPLGQLECTASGVRWKEA